MQKLKHNKKRNTAFLYESLIRELTKTIVEKEERRKDIVLNILKESFEHATSMYMELRCYKNFVSEPKLNQRAAEKLLLMTKQEHMQINKRRLFNEQTKLINRVNRELGKEVFSNFVPNYKDLATIFQIFNTNVDTASRVLLEESVIYDLTRTPHLNEEPRDLQPVSNLVYKTFVEKFNSKYSQLLSEQQQTLLNRYILSFVDNGVDLKLYLNEEIGRLKNELHSASEQLEFSQDENMKQRAQNVLSMLEGFSTEPIDTGMIRKVLKIQNLVTEISA
jgi:hypothetical protein